jgi:DNA-binding CsgD family transcriptional regulator
MARTAVAEHLAATVPWPVATGDPEEPEGAMIIVFLGAHEPPNTLPRVLRRLSIRGARIILGYDTTAGAELSDLATRFGVWALFDIRADIRVLIDLVRRGLSSPVRATPQAFSPALARWHVPPMPNRSALTAREREVARLLCTETPLSVEEASLALGISIHTVHAHLRNIRAKVGARYTGNRDALRDALLDLGWLE